jgi:hypothetical protein
MATKATPVETPVEIIAAPTLYVVVESFLAVEGGTPVPYRRGEMVEADDPHVKLMPDRFRPFKFPHPLKRRGTMLTTPELRAE